MNNFRDDMTPSPEIVYGSTIPAFDVDPRSLRVEYTGTELVDEEGDEDAGLARFQARLVVGPYSALDSDAVFAAIEAGHTPDDEGPWSVAVADITDVRPGLLESLPAEALDNASAELSRYGVLFDGRWLRDDLPVEIGTSLLIIDRVWVVPAWRGRKLGQLLTAVVMRRLTNGTVAATPGAFELAFDDPARVPKTAQIHKLWRNFGFFPFPDDPSLLLFDMAKITMEDTFYELCESAGRLRPAPQPSRRTR